VYEEDEVGKIDVVGFPNGCTRAVHAEANAIAYAARVGVPIEGASVYCTLQPCVACAQLLVSAKISRVVYLEPYRSEDGINLLKEAGLEVVKYG
jgi:dCMP deaminase